MQQYKTVVIEPGHEAVEDPSTGAMIHPDVVETWRMGDTWNHSTNILGLVIFSVATGIAIGNRYILSMGVLSQIFCQMGGKCIFSHFKL